MKMSVWSLPRQRLVRLFLIIDYRSSSSSGGTASRMASATAVLSEQVVLFILVSPHSYAQGSRIRNFRFFQISETQFTFLTDMSKSRWKKFRP